MNWNLVLLMGLALIVIVGWAVLVWHLRNTHENVKLTESEVVDSHMLAIRKELLLMSVPARMALLSKFRTQIAWMKLIRDLNAAPDFTNGYAHPITWTKSEAAKRN